jgi:hypothetical protein
MPEKRKCRKNLRRQGKKWGNIPQLKKSVACLHLSGWDFAPHKP